jgi:NitT/TauT family transport system permease protein
MSAFEAAEPPVRLRSRFRAGIPWNAVRILVFYAALVGGWQGLYFLELWPPYVFPAPLDVWHTLWSKLEDGTIGDATVLTLKRMGVGYSLSILIGLAAGIAMGTMKWVDETLGTLVVGLQSLPSITWLPLALLWFGLNERAIIFVVLMGSVNSIAISSRSGVRAIPQLQTRAARMFGAKLWQMYLYVLIPGMLPSMVQGLKLGWSFAWRSLLAGELLFVSASLGYLLQTGRDLNDVQLVMAVMLVIVAIGVAVDRVLFARLERLVNDRWGLPG